MAKIAVIVPTYEHWDYSRATLETLFETCPDAKAVVVDDHSPTWNSAWLDGLNGDVLVHRFPAKGGLTRSWNKGLEMCLGDELIVAGNNDILFTPDWWKALDSSFSQGFALVGPLSNAPGDTAGGLQDIKRYVRNYTVTDTPAYLAKLASGLLATYKNAVIESVVNGFFMAAPAETWFGNRWDAKHVFNPVNLYSPSGKPNPTPLMTGNEDELQHRLHKKGLKTCVALGSFIFHYRSVSRGTRFAKGGWHRRS